MDVGDYLPMFLAESREHLQDLTLAVVGVEEQPDDAATIEEIFRIAHSLKGMSATMGFERVAALTHAMEDLFEVLRVRRGGVERPVIDLLLETLDVLGAAFESIESDGVESLDEQPLVERLQALVRTETARTQAQPAARPDAGELVGAAAGRPVLHVTTRLNDDVLMPSVRALMVLTTIAEHGEVLASVPPAEAIDGFDGRTVEIWLASDHDRDVVLADIHTVPDVGEVAVGEVAVGEQETDAPRDGDGREPADREAAGPEHDRARRAATSTVRVDAERLDQLMHLMGELVVHRTRVESLLGQTEAPDVQHAMNDLTRSSQALQAMVMQVRMIPVEAVFLRFPRLVRDLSAKLGKQVDLRLEGADTEFDRTVVDALGDPLVHLVRNALDHGLEDPEQRQASGKPGTGVLEIAARHSGSSVLISVRDDGRGIDPRRVAAKAVERGLIAAEEADGVDTTQAIELLFSPGFSTAETTTEISGRGVGLDAVRTTVRELGGEVVMQSKAGAGTTTQIRLPLTLAIAAMLLVEANNCPFVVQLDRVEMTVQLDEHPVRLVAGRRTMVLRGEALPIIDLAGALGHGVTEAARYGVVVRGAERRAVLAVEHLVGQRELVTRPLPEGLDSHPALSGGAVLSDGQIALIVDCDVLCGNVVNRSDAIGAVN